MNDWAKLYEAIEQSEFIWIGCPMPIYDWIRRFIAECKSHDGIFEVYRSDNAPTKRV